MGEGYEKEKEKKGKEKVLQQTQPESVSFPQQRLSITASPAALLTIEDIEIQDRLWWALVKNPMGHPMACSRPLLPHKQINYPPQQLGHMLFSGHY